IQSKSKEGPHWSMPCRVIELLSQGHGARVEDLSNGEIKETHLQNARFIKKPKNPIQVEEWIHALSGAEGAQRPIITRTMELLRLDGIPQVRKKRKNVGMDPIHWLTRNPFTRDRTPQGTQSRTPYTRETPSSPPQQPPMLLDHEPVIDILSETNE